MDKRRSTPDQQAIGDAMKDLIRAAGLRQEDVARASGIPMRTFARYLAGTSAMPITALINMAHGLGVGPGDLAEAIASRAKFPQTDQTAHGISHADARLDEPAGSAAAAFGAALADALHRELSADDLRRSSGQ